MAGAASGSAAVTALWFPRAVAVDHDGTLTTTARPTDDVLAAVAAARAAQVRVVLVTGRILGDLEVDFPGYRRHFDCVVAENGAVLAAEGRVRLLASPVEPALERALCTRGVAVRRGQVLLAMDAEFDRVVLEEIARLGLEYQLVRNRRALMVLPHDVTKGSGVRAALADLALSPHSVVAIGDAENDHSLLDACEIGVAVGNAVESLKAHADLVLAAPNGDGIAILLRSPELETLRRVESRRWRITLGASPDGTPVRLPASRINVGIFGASGTGKSYVAGLVAEQLVRMEYTICILDLEGDHSWLGDLPGIATLDGRTPPLSSEDLDRLVRQSQTSIVLDLSLLDPQTKQSYALSTLDQLRRTRAATGLPHWIIADEAHVVMSPERAGGRAYELRETGFCIVTYRPDLLCEQVRERLDAVITLGTAAMARLERRGSREPVVFTPLSRMTPHLRHWHKYLDASLPPDRRFFFRDSHGPTGRSASNLTEFSREIGRADEAVLRHHAAHRDFSRWLTDLLRDPTAVARVRAAERAVAADVPGVGVQELRRLAHGLEQAVQARLRAGE